MDEEYSARHKARYTSMNSNLIMGQNFYSDTEADTRAKMLISLIESKLITLP